MRVRVLAVLLLAGAGCESKPELELCERIEGCDGARLLTAPSVCAEQVRAVFDELLPDCARCAGGLTCAAVEGILRGEQQIRVLCSSCPDEVGEGAAGEPGFLSPAIAIRERSKPAAEGERAELSASQAEAVCELGDSCDAAELRVNTEECARQVRVALEPQSDDCRRCAASLSCAGVQAVVRGEQRLSVLCRGCSAAVDPGCLGADCSEPSFLLIPAFVAGPSEPAAPAVEEAGLEAEVGASIEAESKGAGASGAGGPAIADGAEPEVAAEPAAARAKPAL